MTLGTVKDATLQLATTPVKIAGRVVGAVARVGRDVAGKAVDTLAPSHAPDQPVGTSAEPETDDLPEVVNVHDELGLDAAPVEKPGRTEKPVTTIDAKADPSEVTATPADVAKAVSDGPESS